MERMLGPHGVDMEALITELKAQARRLHRDAVAGEPKALARLKRHPELRKLPQSELTTTLQRRHALATLARELGLSGWPHLLRVLSGQEGQDFGSLLYPQACGAHSNIWSAHYAEAKTIRAEHGGYLLQYKSQFLVVEHHFLNTLGVPPTDGDWEAIGRDWARPADPLARVRLCRRVVRARLAA